MLIQNILIQVNLPLSRSFDIQRNSKQIYIYTALLGYVDLAQPQKMFDHKKTFLLMCKPESVRHLLLSFYLYKLFFLIRQVSKSRSIKKK